MGFWNKFFRHFLLGLRTLLFSWIKVSVLNRSLNDIGIDAHKPICYVLPHRSIADALVLLNETQELGLVSPFDPLRIEGTFEQRSIAYLKRPKSNRAWWGSSSKPKREHSARLSRLLQSAMMHPNLELQLVPVQIFWGRSPTKENSLWKIVFSDTWSSPGIFRKALMILINGRETFIEFGVPIQAREIIQHDQNIQLHMIRLDRVFRTHFRKQREALIGPDLSHRRTLVTSLLQAPSVLEAIEQVSTDERSREIAFRQALKYSDEIASDYSHAVIRAYHRILTWIWNRLYDGVEIFNIETVRKTAQTATLIYTPSHRSHIDYLLLSYVLFVNGLAPPHIAAGINLNLPIIGSLLRRGGAFFMRRSFKDNPLYAAVFNEYFNTVLSRGFPVEYFIEGGRSRSGFLLQPRKGMLSMTVQSHARDPSRKSALVPVYFGYERLFEGNSYLKELGGEKKSKETFWGFIQSLRKLKRQFGKVYVSFGEPILLQPSTENESIDVLRLGEKLLRRINEAGVVHRISYISLIILSAPRGCLDEKTFIQQIQLYLNLMKLKLYPGPNNCPIYQPVDILNYGISMGILSRIDHELGSLIAISPTQSTQLLYFRNNVLHFIALPSIIALHLLQQPNATTHKLKQFCLELLPWLRQELFVMWDIDNLETGITQCLTWLKQEQLIHVANLETVHFREEFQNHDSQISIRLSDLNAVNQLQLLGLCIRPLLERLFIVISVLKSLENKQLTSDNLEKMAHSMTQRLTLLGTAHSAEYHDRKSFQACIRSLFSMELIWKNSKGVLEFDERIHHFELALQTTLPFDFRHHIGAILPNKIPFSKDGISLAKHNL
ncbi:MAG: glycerol-3-phosphate 1-O-acyltransferase PlsB [Pseudomonadota bacterium]